MDQDHPTSPYNSSEQMRIMMDLQKSKREADQDGDELRTYYLNEIESD